MKAMVAAFALALSTLASLPVIAQPFQPIWVGTWATAPVALPPPAEPSASAGGPLAPARIRNQTIRQIVRISIGGTRVRVALTNTFGTAPLEIGAAHVALRDEGPAIDRSAATALTFRGRPSATIEAGSTILSDPVDLAVPPLADLVIDLYLPGDSWDTTSPATSHGAGLTTNYLSPSGNHAGAAELPVESTVQSWFYLSHVDVTPRRATGAIVAFGDSITDGTASTPDTNSRWPDFLARRLAEALGTAAPAVLNLGIAGNRILSDNPGMGLFLRNGAPAPADEPPPDPNAMFGPRAVGRLDRDVLLQPGATHMIVLESINDIGMSFDAPFPTVEEIVAGHRVLIQRAHPHGLTVYGGTLTPFEGAFYYSEAAEAKRQAVNEWIRTSGAYDAVIDFDAAMRDPGHPTRIHPDYNPGDSLHFNDAGYRAMAEAIDLSLFETAVAAAAASATPQAASRPWVLARQAHSLIGSSLLHVAARALGQSQETGLQARP